MFDRLLLTIVIGIMPVGQTVRRTVARPCCSQTALKTLTSYGSSLSKQAIDTRHAFPRRAWEREGGTSGDGLRLGQK